MVSQSAGRRGHTWREVRRAVLAEWGDVCVLCGHVGANEIDHLIPMSQGGDPESRDNLRPMHGSNSPCPVCIGERTGRPRCCNQEKQARDRAGLLRADQLDELRTDPLGV